MKTGSVLTARWNLHRTCRTLAYPGSFSTPNTLRWIKQLRDADGRPFNVTAFYASAKLYEQIVAQGLKIAFVAHTGKRKPEDPVGTLLGQPLYVPSLDGDHFDQVDDHFGLVIYYAETQSWFVAL